MDIKMQYLLKKNRASLQDVDVDDILDDIISSGTLTDEDIEIIKNKETRTDKTNTLIDIVSKNGAPCYIEFVKSLSHSYNWLWEKLQIKNTDLPVELQKDILADILHQGNVPKLPIHYVKRVSREKELHDLLARLERHQTLTLHGMSGSGKTSLVISTLRCNNELVINSFNGKVFWISVGDCMTDDQIFQLQSCLHRRIQQNNTLNMSASDSLEFSDYTILVDQDWKENRTKLIEAFNKNLYKEALLVIDDPKNKQIVEAFDIGCKLLVITQDSSLVESSSIYKLESGLSEEESLELISKSINQDVKDLPDEAKKMHRICHGTPLLMAMLGGLLADNKDSLKNNNKAKWKAFLKQLKNKPTFLARVNSRKNLKDNTSIWLEMGINSLENEDLKTKYKSLAIFSENIKVSVKALAVILDMTENEVDDFMAKLEKKSLITKHYNVERKTYEYEINDLIMSHLKHIHTQDDFKRLHAQLISRYLRKCANNDLVNLPDDGYICYFIGYHIRKTDNLDGMWEFFGLYTNLEFIGHKIRLAGPSDTIEDLKKYSEYIIKYSKNSDDFVGTIGKFISNYGHDLHYYPHTDILQSIMQYEPSGNLFEQASSLAKKDHNLNHVYFQFLPNDDSENYAVMNIGSEISFIKFWWEYVFIGHTDGLITLWRINENQKIKTFYGHKTAIKCISINSQSPCRMGSVCDDGIVKIWNIDDHLLSEQDSSSEAEDEMSTICDTHNSISTLKHESGPYRNIVWGRNHNIFLCHTSPGNIIMIHDLKKQVPKEIACEECVEIKCSLLSYDNTLAIVGYNHRTENQFGINLYCRKTGNRMMTFTEQNAVLNLSLLLDDKQSVLVLTNKYIHKHKWKKVVLTDPDQAKDNVIHSKVIELDNDSKYEFCMMKLGTDNVIFVSTTDCRILVYNINKSDLLCEFNNYRGIISLMDYMEYKTSDNFSSHLLITAGGVDQTYAKLWFVNDAQFKIDNVRKTPKFDCVFDSNFHLEKTVKVSPVSESSEIPVRRVKTLSNGNKVSKPSVCKTTSLDRQTLKNLNLPNLSRKYSDNSPVVAIIDSNRCVQVFKGNALIAKTNKASSNITCVASSPCGRYLIYGLEKGEVINFTFKPICHTIIMEINDHVNYIEFLNSTTVVVAGKDCSLMVYEIVHDDFNKSKATMLIKSFQELGSQEILDNIIGKKKSPTPYSRNSSYSSSDSIVSIYDNDSPDFVRSQRKCEILYKRSPTVKCFIIENFGMLSVERNGCVKLWDTKYKLSNVLIKNEDTHLINFSTRKEDLCLTCVCVQKYHLIMCDKLGNFRIYNIKISNSQLSAKIITSYRINEKIISCALSQDEKYLALGCTSGNIVLWDVTSGILISKIKFHKDSVHSLIFSPTPVVTQPISNSIIDDCNRNIIDKNQTPLVLVSLSGQICWWDITSIINKKMNSLRDRKKILSHIETLITSSPLSAQSQTFNNGGSCNFEFSRDLRWENLWKNKKSKNTKRKELLNCVKLKGERAFKILASNDFSTFVTIDQGGVLHIMKMFHNNETENGVAQNNHSS